MTHNMTLLVLQLSIIIISCRLFGYIFERYLKMPKVLGELLSGIIIGPYALGGIKLSFLSGLGASQLFTNPLPIGEAGIAITPELWGLAVIASIVLLFLTGLETDLPTFIKFSGKGSFIGLGGIVFSFVFGDLIAVAMLGGVTGFMHPTALFMGVMSVATSVGITAQVLSQKKKMSTPEGVTILAAAVFDDVVGIIVLAVVLGIGAGSGAGTDWAHIGIVAGKALGIWLVTTLLGIFFAPKLTKGMKRFKSMEIVAGISFGIALFLAGFFEMFGLAMIIGAYIAGLSLSQTDIAYEIREHVQGIYDFLVPIFFCVMGMLVDLSIFNPFENSSLLIFSIVYVLIAIVAKVLGCGLPALLSGFNLKGASRIGFGMLPRGEVILIMASQGLSKGLIGQDMFGVAVMTMIVTTVMAIPGLLVTFRGGSGYRAKKGEDLSAKEMKSIELEFATPRMAEFIKGEILESFRNEEFFIQKVDHSDHLFYARKDAVTITLALEHDKVSISMLPQDETFVRLLVVEDILAMKDLLSGLESMKSPDMMGAELMMGMFSMFDSDATPQDKGFDNTEKAEEGDDEESEDEEKENESSDEE
ncbi:MAG: cation:proton antiporter [Spirochaetales bacterium]|nr:cation:proton antiporter [Spirochaetales bacterium]